MVLVADLVARISAVGVQETAAAVKAVGESATQTARALEIMSEKAAKVGGGTAAGWLDIYQRSGAVPTQAALAQATLETQKTTVAQQETAKAAEKTGLAIRAIFAETKSAAGATEEVSKNWNASESSVVRFASALVGVNLGISLIAGAGRLLHAVILDTASAQLVWEQSLMRTTALYGSLGSNVVTVSQAQANAPGMAGSQQEFLSANLNARYLGSRFGVSQASIYGLTSAGGRLSSAFGYDAAARDDLQARMLAFTEGGGSGLRNITGTEGDPLSISRRLGGVSGGQLAALTPGQLRDAQAQIATLDANQTALSGANNVRGLVQIQAEKEKMLSQAQDALQNSIESFSPAGMGFGPSGSGSAGRGQFDLVPIAQLGTGPAPERRMLPGAGGLLPAGTPALGGGGGFTLEAPSVLTNAVREAQKAFDDAKKAVVDTTTALAENKAALEKMGITYGTATFRLLGFTGSLEDPRSIARGDIASQAQQAVTDRMRGAFPGFATPPAEIAAVATSTAWEQAKQNLIARRAQGNQDNGIRGWLQDQGPEGATAISEAERAQPVQKQLGEARTRAQLIDYQTADTQAKLEALSLTQRERYVKLLQDTVDLRRLDNQQQQIGLAASMEVVRMQQAALPAQQATSAARYQQNMAVALGERRMAMLLSSEDVSGQPTVDQLIQMNYQGQIAEKKLAPDMVTGARGVEVAGQAATAASLQQALTAGQLQGAQLAVDAQNLTELPKQTQLMMDGIQNSRDQLSVNTEIREYLKKLVFVMTNQPAPLVPSDRMDRIEAAPPAPSDLPGARHQ